MKFDVIVGNPPYGMRTNYIHLNIMQKSLSVCSGLLTFIMPSKPIIQRLEDKWYNMFRNAVCTNIEVVGKEVFGGTEMDNTAIYYCDRKCSPDNYCKKIDVQHGFWWVERLEGGHQTIIPYGSKYTVGEELDNVKKRTKEGMYYLNVNRANGSMGGVWLSNTLKVVPVMDRDGEIDFCMQNNRTKNIVECPSLEYGNNLKRLMSYGLVLRFSLWITQISQAVSIRQFRYIPDLDYTYITTDEELLSECGFTTEEIKKVMDYLKHFDFSHNRNDLIRNFEK